VVGIGVGPELEIGMTGLVGGAGGSLSTIGGRALDGRVLDSIARYPQTKSSILLQIFEDKFDPFDLAIKGKFGIRKRLGSSKDLERVRRWSNAFLQYISIISDF
jgi:hypothetical protein